MEKTTIRVPEGTLEAIDAEAEEQGMTRSQYIRWVLENRERIREHTGADGDLEQRLSEIESRLDELES